MIKREAWHVEVASFEKERDLLYRQYSREEISAEEFATKMLRFWQSEKGSGSLLETSEEGGLFVTPEWLYANSGILQTILDLKQRWRREVRTVQNDSYLSPKFISENVTEGRLSVNEVQNARILLMGNPPQVGDDLNATYGIYEGMEWRNEQDFGRWLTDTTGNSRMIVEAYEADEQ